MRGQSHSPADRHLPSLFSGYLLAGRVLRARYRNLLACALLATIASCGGGGGGSEVSTPIAASASIGPAGGTVSTSTGAQAIFPAGALASTATISIRQVASSTPPFPPAGFASAGALFEFFPHGTPFALPVTVRIPFDPALVPPGTTARLYHAAPGGSFTEVPGTTIDGNVLVASVTNFSYFGPGYPDALGFSEISGQCARESLSGNVWCWGDQGDIAANTGLTVAGANTTFAEPTRLPPRALTKIVGGYGTGWVCGLDATDVWCIGDPLVTGLSGQSNPPLREWVRIPLPTGVVLDQLAGGAWFVCGIGAANSPDPSAAGRVYCWGDNTRGQLGRGNFESGNVPAPLLSLNRYVAVAAVGVYACAARTDGQVDCWGSNEHGGVAAGQLGGFDLSNTPVARNLTVDPRAGALVGGGTGSNMCGLKVDGSAWCWGDNDYGQMGNGTVNTGAFGDDYRAPSEVPVHRFRTIWPGETMCGITLDGSTLCWGYADRGSLGNGTNGAPLSAQTTPVAVTVPGGVSFASMSNASLGKCARSSTNEVFCWGDNRQFSLGTGANTPDQSHLPIRIKSQGLSRVMP